MLYGKWKYTKNAAEVVRRIKEKDQKKIHIMQKEESEKLVEEANEWLKELFSGSNEKYAKMAEKDGKTLAKITFRQMKDGSQDINMDYADMSDETADFVGKFLYAVHSGYFEDNCWKMLQEGAISDPNKALFINKCMLSWKDSVEDDLTILPSEVFGMGRGNQPQ